jgi:TP901 family phage tail tape measure protein
VVSPVFVELKASSADFMAKMGAARAEITHLGTGSKANFAKLASAGKQALLGIAGAATVIGYESVKAASSFQAAMEQIHTQAGVGQRQVDALSKAVLRLAGPVATAPDELAKGLYHIESTLSKAIPPAQRMREAMSELRVAAEGAKVGGADLEDVTNALNGTVASGIPGVKNLSQAMGALNATVGAGDMRMQDLADAMGSGMLAVVKGFGVNLTQVGAALATFGDNNIRGANAATQLRMGIMSMAKPAATGKAALKELGLTTRTLAKDLQTGGLTKAVTDLHDRLTKAGLGGKKAGETLTEAFGKKAGPAIAILTGQFARFQSKLGEVRDGAHGFNSAWESTTQTFQFKLQKLQATVEALAVRIGTALIPYVEKAAAAFASATGWLERHRTVAEALAVVIGGALVTAIAAYAVSAAVAAAATIAAAAPILAIIVAVTALGVGVYELYKHWDTVWADIKKVAFTAWDAIKGAFDDAVSFLRSHEATIAAILILLTGPIGILVAAAFELMKHWNTVWHAIETVTKAVWSVIGPLIRTEWRIIWALLQPGLTLLRAAFKLTWDYCRDVVKLTWTVIRDVVQTGWALIKDVVTLIADLLQGKWGAAWNQAKKLVSDAIHGIGRIISDWAKGAGTLLVHAGEDIIHGLIGGMESVYHSVKSTLGGLAHKIVGWKGPPEYDRVMLFANGQLIIGGLIGGMESKYAAVADSLARLTQSIRDKVLAGIRGAVAPGDTSVAGTLHAYIADRMHAINKAQSANVSDAHAKEMAEHAADLARKLDRLKKAHTDDVDAASKHAQKLGDEARNARYAAEQMTSKTKADRAAKSAAEDHARALGKEATEAAEAARNLAHKYAEQEKGSQAAVDAAKKAADAAKAAADKADKAAVDAAQRAQDAAKALVSSVSDVASKLADQIASFKDTIASAVTGDYSLSTLWQNLGDSADLSGLQSSLDATLASTQQFAADLQALAKKGAGQELISQIAAMGPTSGDQLAKQLLAGGTASIDALQSTMAQIAAVAGNAGLQLANAFYGHGVDALDAYIKGLEKKFPELKAALDAIRKLVDSELGPAAAAGQGQPGDTGGMNLRQGSGLGGSTGKASGGTFTLDVPVQVVLDGQVIATASARYTRDALLRDASATKTSLWGQYA